MDEKIQRLREKAHQLHLMANRVNQLDITLAWGVKSGEGNERLSDALAALDEAMDVVGLLFPGEF